MITYHKVYYGINVLGVSYTSYSNNKVITNTTVSMSLEDLETFVKTGWNEMFKMQVFHKKSSLWWWLISYN